MRAWGPPTVHELHVAQPSITGQPAGVLEKDGIGIEGNDVSRRTHAGAQQFDDAAWPAAEVQAAPAGPHADAVEHDTGVEVDRGRLHLQALYLARAPLDQVVTCGHRLSSLSCSQELVDPANRYFNHPFVS